MTIHHAVETFIRHKESIGHVFATDARVLRRFCGFVGPQTSSKKISTELISPIWTKTKLQRQTTGSVNTMR